MKVKVASIFVPFLENMNFILVNNELTVYNQGARFLHHQPAGRVHFRDGFLVPEPSDGWLGISGGLTGQNCYCVDGKGLIGRSHGYDWIFL